MRSSASAPGAPHHFVSQFVLRFRKAKQSEVIVRRAAVKTAAVLSGKMAPLPRGRPSFTMINTASQSSGKYVAREKQTVR